MAKQSGATPPANPSLTNPATGTEADGNNAAPNKKKRNPIKYTNIVESEYKATDNPDAMHPLDKPAMTSRGGLKFPGVEFEQNFLGIVVKIPGKATIVKNPTVRQLLKVLDKLYS